MKIKKKKQVDALKTLKSKERKATEDKSDDNEKHFKYKEVFNELSNESIGEIYNISKKLILIIQIIVLKVQIVLQ